MVDPSDDVSDVILHQVDLELGQSSLPGIRLRGVELDSMVREYALRLAIPRSRTLEHRDSVIRGCLPEHPVPYDEARGVVLIDYETLTLPPDILHLVPIDMP